MQIERIGELTKLFKIQEFRPSSGLAWFEGFLVPNENYVCPYNEAAVGVYGRIQTLSATRYPQLHSSCVHFIAGIYSSDDSSAVIHGPSESGEKATKRLESFLTLIQNRHPMMPKIEELTTWCINNVCYLDIN